MISEEVREMIPKIREFLKTQPVKRAWLFGSCSRGEETPESDIDILVNYDDSNGIVSLFRIFDIQFGISDLTGREVDLIDEERLYSRIRPSVEQDEILIYERNS